MGHVLHEPRTLLVIWICACSGRWQGYEARAACLMCISLAHLVYALRRVKAGSPRRCMGPWCKADGSTVQDQCLRSGQACRLTALVSEEVPPAGAALEQLDQFTPEHLSRLLWAYSTLRIYSPELYSAVSSVATLLQTGTSRLIRAGSSPVSSQALAPEPGVATFMSQADRLWRQMLPMLSCTGAAGIACPVRHAR